MKGFTLIELLVVVLIIGILSAVALPQYQKAVTKARVTEAKTALKSLVEATQLYILENGNAPSSMDDLTIGVPSSKNWTYFYHNCKPQGCALGARPSKPNLPSIWTETANFDPDVCYYGVFELLHNGGKITDASICSSYGGVITSVTGTDTLCAG